MMDRFESGVWRPATRREIEFAVVGWAAFAATGIERADLAASLPAGAFKSPLARVVWLYVTSTPGPHSPESIGALAPYRPGLGGEIEREMRLLKPVEEIESLALAK